MESGTAGAVVTAQLLTAATHGSGGRWTTTPSPMRSMRVSTAFETRIRGPVEAGGVIYWDTNSTRSFAMSNWTTVEFARYEFTERHPRVSMGIFVRLGDFHGPNAQFYDLFALEAPGGEFLVLSFEDNVPEKFAWRVHTGAGTGDDIPVVPNKTYWVTALWDRESALASIEVYDPVTWDLFGSSYLWLESDDVESFYFGRYDDHGTSLSTNLVWFDDLMLDLSGNRFPLLPDEAGASIIVTSLNPANGVPGSSVTLQGANFNAGPSDNVVQFGEVEAEITAATTTTLTVLVPSGLSNGPVAVTVTANGRTSNARTFTVLLPQFVVTNSVAFGDVTVGVTATRTLAIRNVGGALLTVHGLDFSDSTFSWNSRPLPFEVGPGSSQNVTLQFAPAATGPKSASVLITTDDPWDPTETVTLSGRGVTATLAAQRTGSTIHVRAATRVGEVYQLESSADLRQNTWNAVQAPFPGDGTVHDWANAILSPPSQRFFRLRVSRP